MIQRIQSVWLFLASIAMLLLLVLPTVSASQFHITGVGLYLDTKLGTVKLQTHYFVMIGTIVVAIVNFLNIFNFKNRANQKRVIYFTIIFTIVVSAVNSRAITKIPGGIEYAKLGVGMFLPMISLLFSVLALKGIKKDDNLIKSADRLR